VEETDQQPDVDSEGCAESAEAVAEEKPIVLERRKNWCLFGKVNFRRGKRSENRRKQSS